MGIWLTVVCSSSAVVLRGCQVVTLTPLLGVLLFVVTLLVHVVTLVVAVVTLGAGVSLLVAVVVPKLILPPATVLMGISKVSPACFSLLALWGHTISVIKMELELSLWIVSSSSSCCSDFDLWLGVQ